MRSSTSKYKIAALGLQIVGIYLWAAVLGLAYAEAGASQTNWGLSVGMLVDATSADGITGFPLIDAYLIEEGKKEGFISYEFNASDYELEIVEGKPYFSLKFIENPPDSSVAVPLVLGGRYTARSVVHSHAEFDKISTMENFRGNDGKRYLPKDIAGIKMHLLNDSLASPKTVLISFSELRSNRGNPIGFGSFPAIRLKDLRTMQSSLGFIDSMRSVFVDSGIATPQAVSEAIEKATAEGMRDFKKVYGEETINIYLRLLSGEVEVKSQGDQLNSGLAAQAACSDQLKKIR